MDQMFPHSNLDWMLCVFDKVSSTNDLAKRLAGTGAPEGTVVVSRKQSMGKGRFGRRWISPSGGLWASLLLRPETSQNIALLPILAGIATAKAVEEVALVKVKLKWPNDLLIGNRKLGGVLVESCYSGTQLRGAIVGLGINVRNSSLDLPKRLKTRAVSLRDIGREVAELDLLQHILDHVGSRYELFRTGKIEFLQREWRQLSSEVGKRLLVKTSGNICEGLATGIDSDGALLVKISTGSVVRVLSSDQLAHFQ